MSIVQPEIEYVDRSTNSIRYLEHGWPTDLCRWHSHEEYELHLIVATHGKAFVGDYIGDFREGSLFLTGPNLPHNWVTDSIFKGEVKVRDMLVQFSQKSIDELELAFPEFQDMRRMLSLASSGIEFSGFAMDFARGRLEEIRDSQGCGRIVAFLRLLLHINERAEKRPLSVSGLVNFAGSSRHARIGAVVDYITENYADPIPASKASGIAGMSSATFSRNFRAVTGNKFIEFVNRIRIGQACSRLYATDEPISSICFDVGYQSLANFNRHFMRMKSMTPSDFRDLARAELSLGAKAGK